VAIAKREVAGVVGIPSAFAGPSEVVVVADDTTNPALAAVDLVVQAEHGPDGLAWLVTWSETTAAAVTAAVSALVESSPRRAEIESTLDQGGYVALVDGPDQAMAVANLIAPEHLELLTTDPEALLPLVRHAGAVFCGPWSPASVGDYLAGPNHVLPTNGSARFAGALRVDDFRKHVHVVTLDRDALARVAPHVIALAEAEGLVTHAESVRARFEPATEAP
jgi:histidinol dehydrogenase